MLELTTTFVHLLNIESFLSASLRIHYSSYCIQSYIENTTVIPILLCSSYWAWLFLRVWFHSWLFVMRIACFQPSCPHYLILVAGRRVAAKPVIDLTWVFFNFDSEFQHCTMENQWNKLYFSPWPFVTIGYCMTSTFLFLVYFNISAPGSYSFNILVTF